ncbi:aldose 1-epimerase family protein [Luteimicrobium subarcticum]|uniref:aldose 1-epimerase family protein n=1 Tax=Luteimicrobium subarcticum TaxID=620910 RepID=UPI001FE357E9|nr:aldose 1-epimerase family protein [Luteimicrobium subarcticum]
MTDTTHPAESPSTTPSAAAPAAGQDVPSGVQHTLRAGPYEAVVTEVGANLRALTADGVEVVQPFAAEVIAPASHGAVLAPWPNRLRDGRYTFDGTEYQVPVTEPARGTALHGLVCWDRWSVVARETTQTSDAIELRVVPVPQPGYPFGLKVTVRYALDADGLTVTTRARATGAQAAPFGLGFHPWLSTRGAAVDDCTLRLDATDHVTVDERLLPTGTEPVAGPYDLRAGLPLDGVDLDDAWVGATRDDHGLSWAVLTTPDGLRTSLWMDASFAAWQVCTGDHITPAWARTAVAVEPMTCVADAFNTGELLVVLAPGEEHVSRWGLSLA